jgi:predicted CXXCH cytochrome family protein
MRRFFSFFLILVLSSALFMIVFSRGNKPHDFKRCSACHLSDSPSGAGARMLNAPVTLLCSTACHRGIFSDGFMHPVDVVPGATVIPPDMLLSASGELVCSTCHDVHGEETTPYGTPTHFLRRQETGKAFCRICHKRLNAARDGHRSSLGEAHFRSRYVITASSQEIDPLSKNCISCHDGSFASSPTILAGRWIHEQSRVRNDLGSHPIGMDYEAARLARGRKTDLKPLAAVDRRIRFFNGKVGCGSCHDPYSRIPKKLVMRDEQSSLCFSCHIV